MKLLFPSLTLLLGSCTLASAQTDSVEDSAQKILTNRCASCHGSARMSDLDVRDGNQLLKGGKRGPAIVPGKAADSLLFKAIKREGELQMPPGKTPLAAGEIETLRKWIDAGAKWPASAKAVRQSSWWSFKKPVLPRVPQVKDAAWVRNPIDAFILAELETKGLKHAPVADRRTLIRRACFDLHGLPPSPKEVEDFVSDKSENAYAKLIDRLLASPRYGERWGRYWLDLVRYADTAGFETDHFYPNAWRYRDYVIESFNTDKPYNTFVQEQIAADEIWPLDMDLEGTMHLPKNKEDNVRRRIGTSLYTLGSFPLEFTYYGDQYRAEWQTDAVDVTGAAFLGLTVACSRCHDHKFDPIRQRDYYSLAAFFAGSEEREVPLVSLFDVQTYTRQFPLFAQLEAMKQLARRRSPRRMDQDDQNADGQNAGVEPVTTEGNGSATSSAAPNQADRAALMRQIGELYTRLPNHFATANVLAHTEAVPDTNILIRGEWRNKGEKVEPAFPPALNQAHRSMNPRGSGLFRSAAKLWLNGSHPRTSRCLAA